ncbi:MAG: DegV family protein [Lachnospiraceae bacterium]|nr:DegV family protein [Lachnospiraceae bacterium]
MRDYIISTTSTADLPENFKEEHDIVVNYLTFIQDGKEYKDDVNEGLSYTEFYDRVREGSLSQTSAVNIEDASVMFEKYAKQGIDVLHISFSSGLSSTYNNECIAAEDVMERYPDSNIVVIDSLCASMGQGLLVYYAVRMKEKGCSLEEVVKWVEDNKLHICHQVTVQDLNHLHRGGRVSKTVAVIGTIVSVKPVIYVNDEGKLIPFKNVRGRKKSLTVLVDDMIEKIEGYDNEIVYIGHGDCEEDAEFVKQQVIERTGITNVVIGYLGAVIGSHAGPGTVALFFLGKNR